MITIQFHSHNFSARQAYSSHFTEEEMEVQPYKVETASKRGSWDSQPILSALPSPSLGQGAFVPSRVSALRHSSSPSLPHTHLFQEAFWD